MGTEIIQGIDMNKKALIVAFIFIAAFGYFYWRNMIAITALTAEVESLKINISDEKILNSIKLDQAWLALDESCSRDAITTASASTNNNTGIVPQVSSHYSRSKHHCYVEVGSGGIDKQGAYYEWNIYDANERAQMEHLWIGNGRPVQCSLTEPDGTVKTKCTGPQDFMQVTGNYMKN